MDCSFHLTGAPAGIVMLGMLALPGFVVYKTVSFLSAPHVAGTAYLDMIRRYRDDPRTRVHTLDASGDVVIRRYRSHSPVLRLLRGGWLLEFQPTPPLPASVALWPKRVRLARTAAPTGVAPQLGNPALDEAAHVEGAGADLLGVCGRLCRVPLGAWIETGGAVGDGSLWLPSSSLPLAWFSAGAQWFLERGADVARVVGASAGRETKELLVDAVRNDPSEAVRRLALLELAHLLPGDAGLADVFASALHDSSDVVVEAAVPHVGAEHAASIASACVRSGRAEVREAGLRRLVAIAPTHVSTPPLVILFLEDPHPAVREAALRASVELELPEARTWVRRFTAVGPERCRAHAVGLLVEMARPEDEEVFVKRLGDDGESVVGAAIEGLTAVGTARSIPQLMAVAEDPTTSASNRSAARMAIGVIQERAGVGSAGAFSIVADGAGGAGAIALADETS